MGNMKVKPIFVTCLKKLRPVKNNHFVDIFENFTRVWKLRVYQNPFFMIL